MSLIPQERLDKIAPMPPGKREAILAAAMAEFCRGYRAASTDSLAAAAQVSKGLLFHYFGDKRTLLHYTAQAALEIVRRDFLAQVNFEESDFFRRLWRITSVRFELMAAYPAIFEFLLRLGTLSDPDFEAPRQALALEHPGDFPLSEEAWYRDVDATLFKEKLDVQKAVNVVRWTFSGYTAAQPKPWETGEDPQTVNQRALQEMWDYISFFRKQFYRPL